MSLFENYTREPQFDPLHIERVIYHPIQLLALSADTGRYLWDGLKKAGILHEGGLLLIAHLYMYIRKYKHDVLWNMPHFIPKYKTETEKGLRNAQLLFSFSHYIVIDQEKLELYSQLPVLSSQGDVRTSTLDVVHLDGRSEKSIVTSTKLYDELKFFDFNRPTNEKHVNELVDSIRRFGNVSSGIVVETDIFTGKMVKYVIDGQHRLLACKKTGEEFHYFTVTVTCIEDVIYLIAKMNSTSKNWSLVQYMRTWASLKAPDYVLLNTLAQNTKLPLGLLLEAVTGRDSKTAAQALRSGTLVALDHKMVKRLVSRIVEIKKTGVLMNSARLYMGLARVMRHEAYNHEGFMKILPSLRTYNFSYLPTEIEEQFRQIAEIA